MKDNLTAIILTFNEEVHLERCLCNLQKLTNNILVVDSGSFDKTQEISKKFGAKFLKYPWPGSHSQQLRKVINEFEFSTDWQLRIDADEYLSDALIDEIKTEINKDNQCFDGFYLKRQNIFFGKKLRFGGMKATHIIRLWRTNKAKSDNNLMDEKIIIDNDSVGTLNNFFYDHNLKPFSDWCYKHIDYSYKEALQSIVYSQKKSFSSKEKYYYYKLPIFLRPIIFFIYRYIFRLGFLDGLQGFIWHFFQGLFYRFLVDVQIFSFLRNNKDPIISIKKEYPDFFR